MVPLAAMLVSLILFRTLGWAGWDYMNDWVTSLRFAVAIMFLVAASAHWGRLRGDLIAMMPPRIPNAQILISLTGILEIAGAIMLLIPATAMAASTGLALMLLAMFPANIYAAQKKLTLGGKPVTPIGARTIMQMLFLAAVLGAGWLPPQG
ncbi:DoxX family protein [Paenibacillus glucanolyticus]|uniref:DoxX family protein n=1 Tax=Paenibacillus glucanolyticus TaxID=59843 RepID=UPI0036ADFC46